MANNWYPVIDYLSCIECGACTNFCPHEVKHQPLWYFLPNTALTIATAVATNALWEPSPMWGMTPAGFLQMEKKLKAALAAVVKPVETMQKLYSFNISILILPLATAALVRMRCWRRCFSRFRLLWKPPVTIPSWKK